MNVLKRTYDFDCPYCHSALSAKPKDLIFNKFTVRFTCPECNREGKVWKARIATRTVRTLGED